MRMNARATASVIATKASSSLARSTQYLMLTLTIDIVVKDPDSGEIVYPSAGDYDYSPPACQAGVFSLSWFTGMNALK
jgi:hypothetical protein